MNFQLSDYIYNDDLNDNNFGNDQTSYQSMGFLDANYLRCDLDDIMCTP